MLPFIGILVAITAMIAIAQSTKQPEKLYRFTSTKYGENKHAIFEIRSNSIEDARLAGRQTLLLYRNELNLSEKDLRWETIEELDPKTKKVITILHQLPKQEKVHQ